MSRELNKYMLLSEINFGLYTTRLYRFINFNGNGFLLRRIYKFKKENGKEKNK